MQREIPLLLKSRRNLEVDELRAKVTDFVSSYDGIKYWERENNHDLILCRTVRFLKVDLMLLERRKDVKGRC